MNFSKKYYINDVNHFVFARAIEVEENIPMPLIMATEKLQTTMLQKKRKKKKKFFQSGVFVYSPSWKLPKHENIQK